MNAPASVEMARALLEQGNALNERFATGVRQGQEAERREYAPLLQAARGVIAAYHRASADEQAKMPTLLHLTISALMISMPELRADERRRAEKATA